jgi:hypothetical protein
MKSIAIILISSLVLLAACKKEGFITSPLAKVTLTADTLKFDTVFTTAGSVTGAFKIVNENDQKLKLSSVKLMGGTSSPFKINVDGFVGPEADNLEIEPNDSMYVFVSVLINPNASNLPFVVQDSIKITYNGVDRWVQLEAWGQNAHFLRNKQVIANETWINDLPYVILGYLYVDTNRILTINKGCRIYVHGDAPIVNDGTIVVNGQKDSIDRVYFTGDRLDEPYKSFPASWPGFYFSPVSQDNVFNYAVVKNSYQALALEGPSINANPKLKLNECIVDNAYDAGIVTLNSSVQARNCLISNCGKNLYLLKGGDYQFTHCTVASYSNNYITHRDPVLLVSNYVKVNNTPVTANLNAVFRNCIFWGDYGLVDDEVVVAKSGSTTFNVNFDANLWKVTTPPSNVTTNQIISNQDPQFDSIATDRHYYDFHLKATSPAINKGVNAGVTLDLDGKPRPVGLPDLGCYEKQ